MTDIRDWANEADLNGEASPAGWPEGMPPSDVNNSAREMMAALRRSYVRQPWYAPGGEIVRVGDNKITIKDDAKVNNYTQYYTVGQRVRVDGVEYSTTGFVSSILYEEPTSTIEFEFDAELPLPPTINEVYVGLNYQDVQGVAGPNLLGCIIGFTDDSSKLGAGLLHANGEKFSPSLYPDLAKLYLLGTESDGSPIYRYGREKVGDVWWPKRPDVRGYFPRFLDDRGLPADGEEDSRVDTDAPRTVGDFQGDTVKNVKGRFPSGDENTPITEGGPFYRLDEDYGWSGVKSSKSRKGIGFDLSLAIPTSDETRPKNIAVVGVIVAYGGVLAGGLADVSELVEDVKQAKALSERVLEEIDTLDDVMNYNGSVEMYSDLPTENNDVGDVYKVLETGTYYIWTEEGVWDVFGNKSVDWGSISGDITAQADLQEALAKKIENLSTRTGSLAILGDASSTYAIAIGAGSVASGSLSFAAGRAAEATISSSTAVGSSAKAKETFSTALGMNTNATGPYSLAVGANAKATAQNAIAVGSYSTSASGPYSRATANYAIQIGPGGNATANTMSVGLSDSLNVQLLNADGKIPAERLPDDIGGSSELTEIAYAGEGIRFVTEPVKQYTIRGSSAVVSDDYIASGFTGSSYIEHPIDAVELDKGFTMETAFALSSTTSTQIIIRADNASKSSVARISTNPAGRILVNIGSSTSLMSISSVIANTKVYVRAVYDGATLSLYTSSGGKEWNLENSKALDPASTDIAGKVATSTTVGINATVSSIDLKACAVSSKDKEVWRAVKGVGMTGISATIPEDIASLSMPDYDSLIELGTTTPLTWTCPSDGWIQFQGGASGVAVRLNNSSGLRVAGYGADSSISSGVVMPVVKGQTYYFDGGAPAWRHYWKCKGVNNA